MCRVSLSFSCILADTETRGHESRGKSVARVILSSSRYLRARRIISRPDRRNVPTHIKWIDLNPSSSSPPQRADRFVPARVSVYICVCIHKLCASIRGRELLINWPLLEREKVNQARRVRC